MNVENILNEIYSEGEIDVIFFAYLAGYVEFDEKDNSFEKGDAEIVEDVLHLVKYLVSEGDFEVGRMASFEERVVFVAYAEGYKEFSSEVERLLVEEGLRCDALTWELAVKKAKLGTPAPDPRNYAQYVLLASALGRR